MWMKTFFKSLTSTSIRQRPSRRSPPRSRPSLEQLEDRTTPSNFTATTASELIDAMNAANQEGGFNTIALVAPTDSPYALYTPAPVIAANNNLTIIGNGNSIERDTTIWGVPNFRL